MNIDDVRAFVDPDEPDYATAALELGPEALPHLAELAAGDDSMLASKAVYLAGLIGGDEARDILIEATAHGDPVIRVAAAASVVNLDDASARDIGTKLLADADVGVRKVTLQSAAQVASPEVRAELQTLAREDDDDTVRELAAALDD